MILTDNMRAPDLARQYADQSRGIADRMRGAYRGYTPQLSKFQAQSFQQPFGAAQAQAGQGLNQFASKLGYAGDLSGMVGGMNDDLEKQRLQAQAGSIGSSFGRNQQLVQGAGVNDLQKGNQFMDMTMKLHNQMPNQSDLDWQQTRDQILEMERQGRYHGMDPMATMVGSTAGKFAGDYFGSRLGKSAPGNSLFDNADYLKNAYNQFDLPEFA